MRLKYRPVRLGLCVRKDNWDDLRHVLKLTYTLRGGRFNPIIPLGDERLANTLVRAFRVDAFYPAFKDHDFKKLAARFPFLGWPQFGEEELFVNGHRGKTAAFLDIYHSVKDIFEEFVKDKPKPKIQTHVFDWDSDDPLNNVLLAFIGSYPPKSEIDIDYANFVHRNLQAQVTKLNQTDPLPKDLYRMVTPNTLTSWEMESDRIPLWNEPGTSVVTSKPAIGGRVKTGQWTASGTKLFYPACPLSGKLVFVRQLLGPHFST